MWLENFKIMKKGLVTNFYFKFSLLFVLLGVAVTLKPKTDNPKERTIKNLNILQNNSEQEKDLYNPQLSSLKIKKS